MKNYLKKIQKQFADPLLLRLGYQRRVGPQNQHKKTALLDVVFSNMTLMGFSPKHIIDVGANHGTWTRHTLKYFPNAYYTLVEPQHWLKSSIQDLLDNNSKMSFHGVGAGAKAGTFKFTITNRDDSHSFRYSVDEAQKSGFQQMEIPVVTLNELSASLSGLPFPDIVKIDAEGLDIDVLQGATDLLGKTEVFLIEAAVGSRLFDNSILKIINVMDSYGYVLFDISDLNRPFSPKILWLVELVFIKKNGLLDSFEIQINL